MFISICFWAGRLGSTEDLGKDPGAEMVDGFAEPDRDKIVLLKAKGSAGQNVFQSIALFTKTNKPLFFESDIVYHDKKNNSWTGSTSLGSW